jgi:M3 family oligoendopeptidase
MQFKDFVYERPDMEKAKEKFDGLIQKFESADSFQVQDGVLSEIVELRNHFETMATLVSTRHSIDTKDSFYEKENDFIDENSPVYEGMVSEFYKVLVASKYKDQLKDKWGTHIFNLAETALKTFDPVIIPLLQEENKLVSSYGKLKASAKIDFEGEERNLSQMGPFVQSKDRRTRIAASQAVNQFYLDHEKDFDDIYDKLVKVRHEIAVKLGFKNFVELGYARLDRTDYNAKDVASYRQQVYDVLVPLSQDLRKRQSKRLGIDKMKFYDESLDFLTGNPKPKGDPDWIIARGQAMYKEMSEETHVFFEEMMSKDLLDLTAKTGKQGGGYCTFIPEYKAPFIFSNFNGTSGDVDVLTHEAGHAFQVYQSRNYELPEYIWPTLEACEIHSMSMEFFAWPWMESFFKEDVDKYFYSHLNGAVLFIPYGVTVDAFQHFVYENPQASPEERKAAWKELEDKFLPHRDYDGYDLLDRGGFWFRQSHIFQVPFYYIDYTLAQVCAFDFWHRSRQDRQGAWQDYLNLCQAGGSQSFVNLLKIANLSNPFEQGSIEKIIKPVKSFLDGIDDTSL